MAILPGQSPNKPNNGGLKNSGNRYLGHNASKSFRQRRSESMYMEKKSQDAECGITATSPTSPSHSSKRSLVGMVAQHLRSPSSNASPSAVSSFSPGFCSISNKSYLRRRRGSQKESKERRNSIQDSLRKLLGDEENIDSDMIGGQGKLDENCSCNSSLSSWNSTTAKFGHWKRPVPSVPRRRSFLESTSSIKARVSDKPLSSPSSKVRRSKQRLWNDDQAWVQSSCNVSNITLPFDDEASDFVVSTTRTPSTPQKTEEYGKTNSRIGPCTPTSNTNTVTPQSPVSLSLKDLKIPQLFDDSGSGAQYDNYNSGHESMTNDLQESFGSLSLKDAKSILHEVKQQKNPPLQASSSTPANVVMMIPPFCSKAFNDTMAYQDSPDLSSLIGHMQVIQTLDDMMKPFTDDSVAAKGSFPACAKLAKHRKAQVRWHLLEAAEILSSFSPLYDESITYEESDAIKSLRLRYRLDDNDIKTIVDHLKLCQELNRDVRWDLIHHILFPGISLDSNQIDRIIDGVVASALCAIDDVDEVTNESLSGVAKIWDSKPTRKADIGERCTRHKCLVSSVGGSGFAPYPVEGPMSPHCLGKYLETRERTLEMDVKKSSNIKLIRELEDLIDAAEPHSKGYRILQDLLSLAHQLDECGDRCSDGIHNFVTLNDIGGIRSHIKQFEDCNAPVDWDLIGSVLELMLDLGDDTTISSN